MKVKKKNPTPSFAPFVENEQVEIHFSLTKTHTTITLHSLFRLNLLCMSVKRDKYPHILDYNKFMSETQTSYVVKEALKQKNPRGKMEISL